MFLVGEFLLCVASGLQPFSPCNMGFLEKISFFAVCCSNSLKAGSKSS